MTGALVNLTADPHSRAALLRTAGGAAGGAGAPAALVGLLRRASLKDLQMSALVCQVLACVCVCVCVCGWVGG